MRVLLMYEHISREGDEIKAIAKALRDKGAEVHIYSVFFQYTKAIAFALRNKCDILVLPWMPSDKYYNFMGWIINSNPEIIIINLAQEEIGSDYSLPALLPRGERAKNCVLHYVWGEYYANVLRTVGIKPNNIVITGNGRTDFISRQTISREELSNRYGLNSKKKWILFAENRGFVYLKKEATIDEHVRRGIDYKESREFYDHSKKALDATILDINTLDNSFFDNYEFIYRPHPGTFAGDSIDKRVKIISDLSIYDWLHVVDANIVWSSTSIFESDAMGIPSIVYEPIENKKRFRSFGTEEYLRITSLREVDEELLEKAREKQESEKAYEKYYGVIDGNRCKNIAKEILNLENGRIGYKALPAKDKDSIKKLLRLALFENVSCIFAKLGLIQKLRWPHMAYNKYSDIPWLYGKDLK